MLPLPPGSILFPYTTLFRSDQPGQRLQESAGRSRRRNRNRRRRRGYRAVLRLLVVGGLGDGPQLRRGIRSEEHTSELQSTVHLVCSLLLETKNFYTY